VGGKCLLFNYVSGWVVSACCLTMFQVGGECLLFNYVSGWVVSACCLTMIQVGGECLLFNTNRWAIVMSATSLREQFIIR
jgi:hypothetical protein